MKKWIATYIFFVGFILFSLSGIASYVPEKTSVKKNITSVGKKTKLYFFKTARAHPFGNSADEVCSPINDFHHAGCSQTVPFLPGEYTPVSSFSHAIGAIAMRAIMIPDGYLLHLFPSHYFW